MLERRYVSQCVSSDYCKGWNDAVDSVVRCKDCKHYESPEKGIFETCMRNGHIIPVLPDDFCSWGESMDGGNEDA